MIRLSPEVAQALAQKSAVVALESTVITHGLPYPTNIATALAMEEAIREAGAIPATIGILAGEVWVGLSAEQIAQLASQSDVRKVSRRDLPIVQAQKAYGATTVAGTMVIAHHAGIELFATGGIGGVHRGHPFDVSADLLELGRTPMTVVCSGAKSILDLVATREVLETQGVTVVGYQSADFPAFFTRRSGLPVDVQVESAQEVAELIQARREWGLQSATLVTVPVPTNAELSAEQVEQAIAQATAEADDQGIRGAAITPYLLQRLVALTDGATLQANTALLRNNARVAAEIGRILCQKPLSQGKAVAFSLTSP